MAEEKKGKDAKPEELSTIGKVETALESMGVDKLSPVYVSPKTEEKVRQANPEVEALEDQARYDAMHGHFLKGEKEHLEAVGKSIVNIGKTAKTLYEKATDGIAAGMEKNDTTTAKVAGELGGPEAQRLAENGISDMYRLHFEDAVKKGVAADKLEAKGAGVKIAAKLGGQQAADEVKAAIEAHNRGDEKAEGNHMEAAVSGILRNQGVPNAAAHFDAGVEALKKANIDHTQGHNRIDELGEHIKGGLHLGAVELEVAGHVANKLYGKATDGIAAGMEKENELVAKLAGKLGGPEARRLTEEATVDTYKLNIKDALKEGLKTDGLVAKAAGHAAESAIVKLNAAIGPKSGKDSRAEWDAVNAGHFGEAAKQLGHLAKDSTVELAGDVVAGLGAGLKKVEGLFGHSSTAAKQPDPAHPMDTPVNTASLEKKGPAKI